MRREAAGLDDLSGEAVLEAAFEHLYNSAVITDADFGGGGPFIRRCNPAFCAMTGYTAEELVGQSPRILQGPDTDREVIDQLSRKIRAGEFFEGSTINYRKDGVAYVVQWNISPVRNADGAIVAYISIQQDITAQVEAEEQNRISAQQLQRQAELATASEKNYRLIVENTADVVAHIRDGRIVWVSPSVEAALGAPPEYWLGRQVQEVIPPEDRAAFAARVSAVLAGEAVMDRVRLVAVDGITHWAQLHSKPFYDADGRQDGGQSSFHLIDEEVAAEKALEEARREQVRADERYRRSIDNAAVGMCLTTPEGRFTDVNDAMCRFFGYTAENLTRMTWQELTAPDYLEADVLNVGKIVAGQIDSYRLNKQFIRADGSLIWGDLSVGCLRNSDGEVEQFIAQITDITAQVKADEQNRILAHQVQQQTDRLTAEMESAANYLSSIMPGDLTGRVSVTSRYLPSSEIGGDSFDYRWIDDDHLLVYLIDVSGHGLEPALLSVSLHNLLRSGSFAPETLLAPEAVLTELNHRFQMDQQGDHYFTIWYGVYEASTRTLRYANAGAPPAFAVTPDVTSAATELSTDGQPLGMFDDTTYTSRSYTVPPGCRVLLYSDGAYEDACIDGRPLSRTDFGNLFTGLGGSPLDDLVETLRGLTPAGAFGDDCSLVRLKFD